MEYCEEGTLHDYLNKWRVKCQTRGLPECLAIYFVRQVVEGLHAMRAANVIHVRINAILYLFTDDTKMIAIL